MRGRLFGERWHIETRHKMSGGRDLQSAVFPCDDSGSVPVGATEPDLTIQ